MSNPLRDPWEVARGYVIVGAKRCGSSHLCALLESSGQLGRPAEYLHPNRVDHLPVCSPSEAAAVWGGILDEATTTNGVSALKVFYSHVERPRMARLRDRLAALHFVVLERRDRLAQAVSLARAIQTGAWSAHQLWEAEPTYDAGLIGTALAEIEHNLASWEGFFAIRKILPLRIVYEDLVENPSTVVGAIARLVGVPPEDLPPLRSGKRVQRDELSLQWKQRYLAGDRL